MDRWTAACRASTGSSNMWRDENDDRYFVEISNHEHADGAITGTVFRMLSDERCVEVGSVRIDGDGRVVRAPAFLKRAGVAQRPA